MKTGGFGGYDSDHIHSVSYMTERLYYTDYRLTEFTARVEAMGTHDRWTEVVLDRSAFYPTGGGQPYDTGLIAGWPVFEVREDEGTGEVLHLLRAGLNLSVGDEVECSVNFKRRFDHTQQHTGQHILSQAFIQMAKAQTVGFHMGEDSSTIDLDWARPDEGGMERAEDLANQIIFEDRPVRVLELDHGNADAMGLRKDPTREGRIRVIEVEDFDRTACGGTHVQRTGEIGVVLVRGGEREKGRCRIEFVCGERAVREYRAANRAAKSGARLLTVGRDDLARKIIQLLEEGKQSRRRIRELAAVALKVEAEELSLKAEDAGAVQVVCASFQDRELDELKLLAHHLAERGIVALLGGSAGEAARLVFAAPKEIPGLPDISQCLRSVTEKFGGRGGGAKDFAHGALERSADLEGALSWASSWIAKQNS